MSKSNLKVMMKLGARPKKHHREAAIKYNIRLNRLIGSPAYPVDNETLQAQVEQSVERSYNPAGFQRQLAAITAASCRRQLVKKIKTPTLVIHGSLDPIIPLSAGQDTAKQIKKAKLKIVDGMGHDFPPQLMPKLTRWIDKHIQRAEKKRLLKKLAKSQTSLS